MSSVNFRDFFIKPIYTQASPFPETTPFQFEPLPPVIQNLQSELSSAEAALPALTTRINRISLSILLTVTGTAAAVGFGFTASPIALLFAGSFVAGGLVAYRTKSSEELENTQTKMKQLTESVALKTEKRRDTPSDFATLTLYGGSLDFTKHTEILTAGVITESEYEHFIVEHLKKHAEYVVNGLGQVTLTPYSKFVERYKPETLTRTPLIETAVKTTKHILWQCILRRGIFNGQDQSIGPYLRQGLHDGFITLEEYKRELLACIESQMDFFEVLAKTGYDLDPERDAEFIAILKERWDAFMESEEILSPSFKGTDFFNDIFSHNAILGFGYTEEQMEEKRQALAAGIFETIKEESRDLFTIFGEGLLKYIPADKDCFDYVKNHIVKRFDIRFKDNSDFPLQFQSQYLPFINTFLDKSNFSEDQKEEIRSAIYTHSAKQAFHHFKVGKADKEKAVMVKIDVRGLGERFGSLKEAVQAYGALQKPEDRVSAMASFKRELLIRYMYELNPHPYLWSTVHPRFNNKLKAKDIYNKIYGEPKVEAAELSTPDYDPATYRSPTYGERVREARERDQKAAFKEERHKEIDRFHREILLIKSVILLKEDMRFLCEEGYVFVNEEKFIKDHDHLKYLNIEPNIIISPKNKELFFSAVESTRTAGLFTEHFLKYYTRGRKTAKEIDFIELWENCPELFRYGIFSTSTRVSEDGTTIGQIIEAQFEEVINKALANNDKSYAKFFHPAFISYECAVAQRIALEQLTREITAITDQVDNIHTFIEFESRIYQLTGLVKGNPYICEMIHYAFGERHWEKVQNFIDKVYDHRDGVSSHLKSHVHTEEKSKEYLVSNWTAIQDFVDIFLGRNGYKKDAFIYND